MDTLAIVLLATQEHIVNKVAIVLKLQQTKLFAIIALKLTLIL